MNLSNWIFKFCLAAVFSLGTAVFVMHFITAEDLSTLTGIRYWIFTMVIPALAFGLFVSLASQFVPGKKKRAAKLAFGLSLVFIGLGAYQHYVDDGLLLSKYVVRYVTFVGSMSLAYVIGFWMFGKDPSWQ